MPRKPHVPSYRHHKSSGQAVVTLAGRDHYLGKHDSPESHTEYKRLIAEWLAGGRTLILDRKADVTVGELICAYTAHAENYYVKAGKPTSMMPNIRYALGIVRELYGETLAKEFGPRELKAVRADMIARKWLRSTVNQRVGLIVSAWKWGTEEGITPPEGWQALTAVAALKAGRSQAQDSEPVGPAPEAAIEAVREAIRPVLRDVIDVQLLTACRPGEALSMRPCDLERTGKVWVYRPATHKTEHKGKSRTILVGPRCQAILLPRFRPTTDQGYWLFPTPRDGAYQEASYWAAIDRTCKRVQVECWAPNQLRHNACTRLVAEFGWEVARIILGHASVDMTRTYAEEDLAKAMDAIGKVG